MHTSNMQEVHFNCPFCSDTRMRMYVNLSSGSFFCHNCMTTGKTFNRFIAKLENIDVETVDSVYGASYAPIETLKLSESLRGKLMGGVNKYLEVDDKSTVKLPPDFRRLTGDNGLVASRVKKYLRTRGVTSNDIEVHGWGYCTEEPFMNRAVLTIYRGMIMEFFVARAISKDQYPKELSPTNTVQEYGKSEVLFNIDRAAETGLAVLSEGIFDALAWGESGVALLGKRCSEAQINVLLSYKEALTDGVIVALDADAKKETMALADQLHSLDFTVYTMMLPRGDPNNLLVENGRKYCRSLLISDAVKPYSRLSRIAGKLQG